MTVTRAIVTGGAGTLGRAAARVLLARGAQVLLLDRDGPALAVAQADIASPAVSGRVADVASFADWCGVAEALAREGWQADFLLNNACPPSARLPLTQIDPDHWRSILGIGLTGAFFGIRTFVPGMVARGRGTVLNMASQAGLGPLADHGDYAAAKAGLVSLSETLRAELTGTGVHVAVACPGAIGRQVGSAVSDERAGAAAGRMDAVTGMEHIIDACLRKEFFIVTHAAARAQVARRAQELMAAFEAAPFEG